LHPKRTATATREVLYSGVRRFGREEAR
jgi:hypothetical protein